MKYVLDLDVNNNFDNLVGAFEVPEDAPRVGEVIVTDAGISFFRLWRNWARNDKILFAKQLQKNLAGLTPKGFAAVTCADSDCFEPRPVADFYSAAKEILPSAKMVFCGRHTKITGVDHYIDSSSVDKPAELGKIVGVTKADKKEPKNGWMEFGFDLLRLFARTQGDYEAKQCYQLPGPRPLGEDAGYFTTRRSLAASRAAVQARFARPTQ